MSTLFRDAPIKKKISRSILFTSVGALLIAGSAIVGYEFVSFRRTAMEYLNSMAEIMGTASAGAVAFGDSDQANEILSGLKDQQAIIAGRLFAANGAAIATYTDTGVNAAKLPETPQDERHFIEGDRLKVFRSVKFREDVIGTIYLEANMEIAYLRLRRYFGIVFMVITLLIPLVYWISDRLRRIIASPIEDLAALAHKIANEKTYSVRAPLSANDEVGRLTSTFNEMLSTIEERDRALVHQSEELWRSNKELEQFAYVSSHDLQEPLRKITTYSQLLEEHLKEKADEESKKYIANIGTSVTRMRNLIQALLTYSRLDREEKKWEKTDLNQSVKEVLNDLESAIADRRAAVTRDPLPTVNWRSFLAQQVFQNLLTNALKFCSETSPVIRITCDRHGGEWRIGVHDNGIGIDPKYAEQIFKVFQRLHSRNVYPGTGIGLAICKKIVEQVGGKIWVESQPGQGASFYFTLPGSGPS